MIYAVLAGLLIAFLAGLWVGFISKKTIQETPHENLYTELPIRTEAVPVEEVAPETSNPLQDLTTLRATATQTLLDDTKIFSAIAHQKRILNKENRPAIAIFLSEEAFNNLMAEVIDITEYTDEEMFEKDVVSLGESLSSIGTPVAFIGSLPVYVSKLLTTAPVYVCGAITWDLQ